MTTPTVSATVARRMKGPKRPLTETRTDSKHAFLTRKPQLAYCVAMSSIDVFHALDDATRRLLLDELSARGDRTLFDLCATVTSVHGAALTRQAISQHLNILEAAGLVVTERRGRSKFHYFDPAPLDEISQRWPAGKGNAP